MSDQFRARASTAIIDSESLGPPRELLELETRLINLRYLLTLSEVTETQKQQLRAFFLAAIAELMEYCEIVDPRLLA
jgi:hypothetical protein